MDCFQALLNLVQYSVQLHPGSFLSIALESIIWIYLRQSFFMANLIAFIAGLLVLVPQMKTLLIGRVMQGASVGIFSSIVPLTVR